MAVFSGALMMGYAMFSVLASVTGDMVDIVRPIDVYRQIGGRTVDIAPNYKLEAEDYRLILKEFSEGLLPSLTRTLDSSSLSGLAKVKQDLADCYNDSIMILADLENGTNAGYALQYLDAAAKPPSGIMDLKWMWVGDPQECKSIARTYNPGTGHDFGGKHFLVFFYINGKPVSPLMPLPLSVGVCMPDSCTNTTVTELFYYAFSKIPYLQPIGAVTSYQSTDYSAGAITALVVCGVFVALMVIGTLIDLWDEIRNKKTLEESEEPISQNYADFNYETTDRSGLLTGIGIPDTVQEIRQNRVVSSIINLMKCFSFTGNTSKLLSTKTAVGPLACLNGMRVLSMWWVIQGHTYIFIMSYIDNIAQAYKIVQRFDFQPIANATFSVDTFFFLSGLLVAYLALKELREKGKLNWVYFFVHRYWRLTPMYAIVLMLYTTMFVHLVTGPYSFIINYMLPAASCEKNWWTNLLYINNLYPDHGNLNTTCMGWTWYLANDMQFYVILSPLLILMLHKSRRVGVAVTVALIAVGIGIRGGLVGYYGLSYTGTGNDISKHKDDKWAQNGVLYQRPYARYSVYLVGMLTGHVLCTTNCKLRMNKILALIGWMVAAATGLAVVYGQYYYNSQPGTHMNDIANGFYASLCRTAWAFSLAWVVLACASGYGGPVHSILSFKIWAPLGRLTYAAYLVHPIIIFTFYANMETPLHFTDLMMIYMFIGNLVISYGVAYLVSMAVEAPMIQLEKLFYKHLAPWLGAKIRSMFQRLVAKFGRIRIWFQNLVVRIRGNRQVF